PRRGRGLRAGGRAAPAGGGADHAQVADDLAAGGRHLRGGPRPGPAVRGQGREVPPRPRQAPGWARHPDPGLHQRPHRVWERPAQHTAREAGGVVRGRGGPGEVRQRLVEPDAWGSYLLEYAGLTWNNVYGMVQRQLGAGNLAALEGVAAWFTTAGGAPI